jgi:hypothetical protein
VLTETVDRAERHLVRLDGLDAPPEEIAAVAEPLIRALTRSDGRARHPS